MQVYSNLHTSRDMIMPLFCLFISGLMQQGVLYYFQLCCVIELCEQTYNDDDDDDAMKGDEVG